MPTNDVASPGPEHQAMQKLWSLSRSLDGGTWAMRDAGHKYLPQFEAETNREYEKRLARSFLLNAYSRAVESLTGKVFSKPIKPGEDVPPQILEWLEDIDLQGNNLSVFAKRVFRDGLISGLTHILADFPRMEAGATLKQEQEAGARPYLIHVPAERLLAANMEVINGREVLTHLRYLETSSEQEGEFGKKTVQRIRVFDRVPGENVAWRLFENKQGNWFQVDEDRLSVSEIPLSTWYTDRTGFMTSNLVLEDLAHKNVEHWQSASDQRNVMTFSRFPILSATGASEEEQESGVIIGPNKALISTNDAAKYSYVEHSGRAIEAGRQDLEDIKAEMAALAMEPLISRPGTMTATERAIDSAEAHSTLQSLAVTFQDTLENAFGHLAAFAKLPTGGSLEVNTRFGLQLNATADLDVLLKSKLAGDISRPRFWSELKRRGVLADDFDAEIESELIQEDGVAFGMLRDG